MKKIRLDNGVEYEAEESVVVAFTGLQKNHDALVGEKSALQAKLDSVQSELKQAQDAKSAMQAECDAAKEAAKKAETDKKAMEDSIPAKIDAALAEHKLMLDAATVAGIEIKPEMKADEVKALVIAKAFPDVKLDGQDATYIKVSFDLAMTHLKKAGEGMGRTDSADIPPKTDEAPKTLNLDEAKKAHDKALQDAWKN